MPHVERRGRLGPIPSVIEGRERPIIAVICGSTRQRADFEQLNLRLTMAGKIVLTVGMFGHETGLDMNSKTKADLDELHLRKIDLADEVHFILKPDGSMGQSTAREHGYSTARGKKLVTHHSTYPQNRDDDA